MDDRTIFHVRMSTHMVDELRRYAAAKDVTPSEVVRQVVGKLLKVNPAIRRQVDVVSEDLNY